MVDVKESLSTRCNKSTSACSLMLIFQGEKVLNATAGVSSNSRTCTWDIRWLKFIIHIGEYKQWNGLVNWNTGLSYFPVLCIFMQLFLLVWYNDQYVMISMLVIDTPMYCTCVVLFVTVYTCLWYILHTLWIFVLFLLTYLS